MSGFGDMSDGELARRCTMAPVDRAALGELVARFGKLVYCMIHRTFRRYGVEPCNDVHDLFQDVFVSLFDRHGEALRRFDGGKAGLGTYIAAVARNRTLNALKSRHPAAIPSEDLPDPAGGPDSAVEDEERRGRLEAALASLTPRDRLFYRLYFGDMLSPEEIGRIMGIGTDSVYARKAKIVGRLRNVLGSGSVKG